MLHKIVTACVLLLGLVIAGLGVASGTVWRPSDSVTLRTESQGAATLLRSDPGVLGLVDDSVDIRASAGADDTVVLVMGHPVDVTGWIAEDAAVVVTGASDWETLDSRLEETGAEATEPDAEATAEPDPEATAGPSDDAEGTDDAAAADEPAAPEVPAPDPRGSDMWIAETSGTGAATLEWDASSDDEILLVASVGESPEAPVLELTWSRVVTTPWMWPGIVVGSVLVLVGLVLGTLWFVRARRQHVDAGPAATPALTSTVGATDAQAARPGVGAPATTPSPATQSPAATSAPTWSDAGRGPSSPVGVGTPGGAQQHQGVGAPAAATQGAPLTRRELRERAEQERIAREEAERAAKRAKRSWPRTGTIPVVRAPEPQDTPAVPVEPEADPNRRAWLPDGTASSSGGGWRQAWGVRPVTDTERPAGTPPDDHSRPEGGQ